MGYKVSHRAYRVGDRLVWIPPLPILHPRLDGQPAVEPEIIHPVLTGVQRQLPWIPDFGLRIIEILLYDPRVRPPADEIADMLRLHSRHALAYQIKRIGLPPYRDLASWIALLNWISYYEITHISLCSLTLEQGLDLSYRYRIPNRLLGCTWKVARRRGLNWAIGQFGRACSSPPDFLLKPPDQP